VNDDIYIALKNLVEGLNKTYWSSWQTTAHFSEQLEAAEKLIDKYGQNCKEI